METPANLPLYMINTNSLPWSTMDFLVQCVLFQTASKDARPASTGK